MDAIPIGAAPARTTDTAYEARLRQAAEALEANFLAEMLKMTDLGQPPEGLGGGAGEEQFASFLIDERARAMAQAGGIGLAQSIFEALRGRADA